MAVNIIAQAPVVISIDTDLLSQPIDLPNDKLATFSHQPLDEASRQIRLIRLQAVPTTSMPERLSLELHHASLNDSISYNALSYAWGNAAETVEIDANGHPLSITRSLYAALHQLRDNGIKSWLWVDALCIDQLNNAEKGSQLVQMRDIFSRANVVYMWLGPGSEKTDLAMDLISRQGAKAHSANACILRHVHGMYDEAASFIQQHISGHETDKSAENWELWRFLYELLGEEEVRGSSSWSHPSPLEVGIKDLLCRDYWHRIWIIQEVNAAKEAIVMAGTRSVSVGAFDDVLNALSFVEGCVGRLEEPHEWNRFGGTWSPNLRTIKSLDIRDYLRRRPGQLTVPLEMILWEEVTAMARPHYTATDPRDILFGILGIVSEGVVEDISADYSMSTAEVFTMITRLLISGRYGHFCLDRCCPGAITGPLPTWVPDFRIIGQHGVEPYRINHYSIFNATGTIQQPVTTSTVELAENRTLRRLGCRVDVITEVMQPPEWITTPDASVCWIKDPEKYFGCIGVFAGLHEESGPGEDYLWRTVVGKDCQHRDNPCKSQKTMSLCRKVMRMEYIKGDTLTEEEGEFICGTSWGRERGWDPCALSDEQVASFAWQWRNSCGNCNRNRTLFKTAKGMLGLGHVGNKVGDIVTLVWGEPSPIILRERGEEGFYFRGDAYVDGIMQGEYLENKSVEEDFVMY